LNPPAAWLWQDPKTILGSDLQVRVGGSFVWPPSLQESEITRVVFVAGGVGINPLMSIVSSLAAQKKEKGKLAFHVKFLYTTRSFKLDANPSEILFLERLVSVFDILGHEGQFELFLTSGQLKGEKIESRTISVAGKQLKVQTSRIHDTDLLDALGPVEERAGTICYICGVPTMTDEFVETAKNAKGIDERNVLFEKWW
jgi:ferredoxin-NADP reductase